MKLLSITALFILFISGIYAQELNCRVQVSHQKIQGTNIEIFNDMQKDIYEFINNKQWTEHVYQVDERIECTFMINISKQIGTEKFIGTITVQSRRPVFNSTYFSTLLNFKESSDDFHFEYRQQEPLEFNINSSNSSLTSVLAFYAYIILGLDYDTFSQNGGAPFFEMAQQIVNNQQSSSQPGWKSYETTDMNNRYWLVENFTNGAYSELHTFLYKYHRLGLDQLADKTEEGRGEVSRSLEHLRNVYRKKPNLYILKLIVGAKSDEIIKLFSESFPREQAEVYNIMSEIDPANESKYNKIKAAQ